MPPTGDAEFAGLRREYDRPPLRIEDLAADPRDQCRRWLQEAVAAGAVEPNAMTLATIDATGAPAARIVLLKGIDDGFVFFTNYASRKGRELAADPRAALVLSWLVLHRQVRVEGRCVRTDDAANDRYWRTRPPGSRLTAAASPQSQVIGDIADVRAAVDRLAATYPDGDVPRPPHWGGVRVLPRTVECWQGGPDRLHQRFRYRRDGDRWVVDRLAP